MSCRSRLSVIICVVFCSCTFCITALSADEVDEGTIIRIGPDRGAQQQSNQRGNLRGQQQDNQRGQQQGQQGGQSGRRVPNRGNAPVVVSRYWIGIEGASPSAALRSQLELEPEEGLVINRIMPKSPAEEGELEQYDVITRVNGKQVASVPELSEHVGEQGENKGRLAIEVIRRGKPRTVWVAPEERPIEQFRRPQPRMPFGIDRPFGQLPFGEEAFGEGPFGQQPFAGLPIGEGEIGNFNQQMFINGVSIKISQQNGGPREIFVQKEGETWEVNENDPESLEALPEEVRPMVERILNQPAGNRGAGLGGFGQDILQRKLEAMQRQMEAMQQQFGVDEVLTDEELEEAVEQAEPVEIELPPENGFSY